MVNSKHSVGVLYKIADCVRTVSRPCAIGDPRGRLFVRAKSNLCKIVDAIRLATRKQ